MMARIRGGSRQAPRHTGQQWGRGGQFRNPRKLTISLGPFERFLPPGVQGDFLVHDRGAVTAGDNCFLRDGKIYTYFEKNNTDISDKAGLDAFEASFFDSSGVGTSKHFFFYRDASSSDVITVDGDDGSSVTTHASSLTATNSKRVSSAVWGQFIYFTSEDLSAIHKYDPTAGTFSSVASTNSGRFLYVQDNNLVLIRATGGVWVVEWSVDGDPEDFTGVGSGSATINPALGEPQGVGFIGDSVLILCEFGAILQASTGSIPAFRFRDVPQVGGTITPYGITSAPRGVFYIERDGTIVLFDGTQKQIVGRGLLRVEETGALHFSKRASLLVVVKNVDDGTTLTADPQTLNWVGAPFVDSTTGGTRTIIADTPFNGNQGENGGFVLYQVLTDDTDKQEFAIDSNVGSSDMFFDHLDIGTEVLLERVEIIYGSTAASVAQIGVSSLTNNRQSTFATVQYSPHETNRRKAIFHVNQYGSSFALDVTFKQDTDSGIHDIVLYVVVDENNTRELRL